MKKQETFRIRATRDEVRELYRFLASVTEKLAYDPESDRYTAEGVPNRGYDREFYDRICNMEEQLATALAAPARTIIL